MKNRVIVYTTSMEAFLLELEAFYPTYVDVNEVTGDKKCIIETTPIVSSDNGNLALSLLTDDELALIEPMTTIKSLGTYEELFANEENHAIYKSVYPYETIVEYIDEEGETQYRANPQKIGEFS